MNRFEIKDNSEGTVIEIDGQSIQFFMILSDQQIAGYLTSRAKQNLEELLRKGTPEYWAGATRGSAK